MFLLQKKWKTSHVVLGVGRLFTRDCAYFCRTISVAIVATCTTM